MKKNLIVGLFLCMASLQILTPLLMVMKRESVLKGGEQFKFRTAPVDPYDAFRGRYVALRIKENTVPIPQSLELRPGQGVYALITVDEQGFARFAAVTTTKPRGKPYLQVKAGYVSKNNMRLGLPIDRYYMEEGAAPLAEKIYREHSGRDKQDAYVLVRVKDGFAVIEALYVGDKRMEDVIRNVEKR